MIDHQALMRVYGALMWSLGKVLGTPEVSRVYIGSFWDQPLRYDMNRKLFEAEEQDLFADLQSLPRNAALRKLNDLIKRARLAKVSSTLILYQSAISKHTYPHTSFYFEDFFLPWSKMFGGMENRSSSVLSRCLFLLRSITDSFHGVDLSETISSKWYPTTTASR